MIPWGRFFCGGWDVWGERSHTPGVRRLPIPVNASCSAPRAIVRIVNHPIDNRCQMLRQADDQAPRRQFIGAQMDGAAGADLHRGCPHPAQVFHDSLDRDFVDARSRVADPTFPFAGAFVNCGAVHQIVDFLVRFLRCNRNRADNTIARHALVSGGASSPIIQLKMSMHFPFRSSLATISVPSLVSRLENDFHAPTN